MPRRRSRVTRTRGSARRQLVWATHTGLISVANGTKLNTDLLDQLQVAGASLLGVTIMRTHLWLTVTSGVSGTDTFTWGLIVATAADVGSAAGAVSPSADPELDWLWWQRQNACSVGTVESYSIEGNQQLVVDSRAKRRMHELNQHYLFCVDGVVVTTSPITIQVVCRTLLALP